MAQNNNILQELNELGSSLAKVTHQNIYAVPSGYFDGLAAQVMNRIKALDAENADEELKFLSPMLNNISKQMPYSVPAGYFDGLEEKLMQSVRESGDYHTAQEELAAISPLLSGLNKKIPYSIPQDYFERMNEQVNSQLNNKTETKIVSITSHKWFRYAAAAMITGVIALAGFLYFNNKFKSDPARSFAKFEKTLNKEIKTTSDKELNDFIQFSAAGLTGEEKVQTNPKEDVKDFLKDVPDRELKKFLEETADPETDDD